MNHSSASSDTSDLVECRRCFWDVKMQAGFCQLPCPALASHQLALCTWHQLSHVSTDNGGEVSQEACNNKAPAHTSPSIFTDRYIVYVQQAEFGPGGSNTNLIRV